MAASSSTDARAPSSAERFKLLRELGSCALPAWAALEATPNGAGRLVVVERAARDGPAADTESTRWLRDVRCLAKLDHPNVVRVRDVVAGEREVLVVSDFVDGLRWSRLVASAPRPSLELSVRVLVDVLSGLGAIHNLRDARRQPLGLVHRELTPDRVLVGLDGIARVAGAHAPRGVALAPGRRTSAYLAPEVLLGDEAADARADVYSVGVMLWEALSGHELFPDVPSSAIVTQILSGGLPRATVPEAHAWAQPLVDVAARALAAEPDQRFGSAAAFAAELRRIAGAKLAPAARVAGLVRGAHGDRIRARRDALERGSAVPDEASGADARALAPARPEASVEIPIDIDDTASTVPPPVRPAPKKPAPAGPARAGAPPPLPRSAQPQRGAAPLPKPPPPPPARVIASPPPLTRVVVPAAPALPKDLIASLGPVHLASAGPRAESAAGPESARPSRAAAHGRWRRPLVVALTAAPVLAVAALVVWWLASRPPRADTPPPAQAPPASPPAASAGALVAAPADTPPPVSADTPAAEPPSGTVPVGAPDTPDTPAAVPSSPSPPQVAAPPAVRPPARPKYEPEGI